MTKRTLPVVMMLFLILILSASFAYSQNKPQTTTKQSIIDQTKKSRVLRVGIMVSKPSVMIDKTDQFIGFDLRL